MKIDKNTITLERIELVNLLSEAAALGAKKVLVETLQLKPYISKSEAYKKYSRRLVERWLKEGLIKQIKDGDSNHSIRLDRLELESVASICNRVSFYRHKVGEKCE